MKKVRRSERLVDMTRYMLEKPQQLISLNFFAERYGTAKSSISEDLSIINDVFKQKTIGELKTLPGASGGVKYIPYIARQKALQWIEEMIAALEDPGRILPGGYIYMTDVLSQPKMVNRVGKIISTLFSHQEPDYVLTVETKGIPLAYATSQYLNIPFVIARRDSRVTEGSVVSINYVSGSTKRIQTMSLSRRGLKEHSRVLIVDDFMKAGGTIRGMMELLKEFHAEVVGVCVLMESEPTNERLVDDVVSLIRIKEVNGKEQRISMSVGTIYELKERESDGEEGN